MDGRTTPAAHNGRIQMSDFKTPCPPLHQRQQTLVRVPASRLPLPLRAHPPAHTAQTEWQCAILRHPPAHTTQTEWQCAIQRLTAMVTDILKAGFVQQAEEIMINDHGTLTQHLLYTTHTHRVCQKSRILFFNASLPLPKILKQKLINDNRQNPGSNSQCQRY